MGEAPKLNSTYWELRAKEAEAQVDKVRKEVEWCDKYDSGDAARMVINNVQLILKATEEI